MTTRRRAHKAHRPGRPWGGRGRGQGLVRLVGLAAALPLALLAASPVDAQAPPPDGAWRTLETPHFRVTYPAGMDALGREAAARAERAWERLADAFIEPPEGRTEILLTDHIDTSNGSARVAPLKQVTVYARPPVDGFGLSHFDDWLEVVLTHELAHVFHLDVSGPLGGLLRSVFGRVPVPWPFFPQLGTPRWTIEGLATWYESALGESGRVRGSYHDMVLRTAALEGRFEDVDEASGASPVWPAGQRPYIYGSLFFDWLLERHGADRMDDFVEAVGDQLVPYRLNAAAREAFGVSFSEAWREWRSDVAGRAARLEEERARVHPITRTEPVTRRARFAVHPRVSPDGRTLVYARSDGRSDSQLRRVRLGGAGAGATAAGEGRSERLVRTNGTSTFDFTPEGDVVFSQLERVDPYRMYGDLYRTDLDGNVHRITREARVDHPSVTPDGREALAIRTRDGTTDLVSVDLATGEVRTVAPGGPGLHWAFPAVSPDGRWVAAARWTEGAYFDVVVLERRSGEVVTEVTGDRALDTAPAWSPDGRWLVWASDRSGIPNVLAAEMDRETGRSLRTRQVTNLLTGAHFPSVSPDGRWLHLSVYHVDGWEVERMPFDPERFFDPFVLDPRFLPSDTLQRIVRVEPATVTDEAGYDPLKTLAPRFWEPAFLPSVRASGHEVIEPSYGFYTSASDLVERHSVDLQLLLSTSGARASGGLGYEYRGLGDPVLSAGVSQWWDASGPHGVIVEDDTLTVFFTERERTASLAATFRRARFRNVLALTLGGGMVWERRAVLDADLSESELRFRRPEVRLGEARATVSFSDARAHAFSVGLEEGTAAFVTGRARRELDLPADRAGEAGSDRSVHELFGRLQTYRGLPGPGFADHVLALRVSAGTARGPGSDASHYDVGGTAGEREPVTGFSLFGGTSWFFPVRGFVNGIRTGRNAWSGSLEYRVPLALVNDGLGLLPIHLDRVSGSLFLDGGNAWGAAGPGDPNPRRDAVASAGGELVADFLTFFSIPLTLRTGVALRLAGGEGTTAYLRFGRSF